MIVLGPIFFCSRVSKQRIIFIFLLLSLEQTSLMIAAQMGEMKIAKLLIEAGSDIEVTDV